MDQISNKTISRATGWSLITEIAIKLVSPITSMILARLLVPSVFGLVATITIVTSFAEVLTDAGFQKYIIQHEFASEDKFKDSFCVAMYANIVFSLMVFAVIFFLRNKISILIGAPQLSNIIAIASLQIIFNSYSSIQIAAYKRFLEFRTLFNVRIILALLPFITTIPFAYHYRSLMSLIVGGLIHSAVQFLFFAIKPKVRIRLFFSFGLFKEMFSFSFWTLLESLTIWLTSYSDLFIVGRMLDEYCLGLYKTSMTTVEGIMKIVSAAVIPILFTTLSRYQNDEVNFKKTFFKFQKLISMLLIPMGIGLYMFRDLATLILLGKKWGEAADFIGMYSVAVSFQVVICYFASEVFRSKGQPKISMFYQWLYIIVLIPSIYISEKFGFNALCATRALISIAFILLAFIFLQTLYGIKAYNIFKNIGPQVFSALIMLVAGSLLKTLFDSIIWQIVTIILCIAIYFFILVMFKSSREAIFEMEFVKSISQKFRRNTNENHQQN